MGGLSFGTLKSTVPGPGMFMTFAACPVCPARLSFIDDCDRGNVA